MSEAKSNGVKPELITTNEPCRGTLLSIRRARDGYWSASVGFDFTADVGEGRTVRFNHVVDVPGKFAKKVSTGEKPKSAKGA